MIMVCFNSHLLSRFDVIILDFDGTLFDTRPAMTESLSLTLRHYGHDVDISSIGDAISQGASLQSTLSYLAPEEAGDGDDYVEMYRKLYLDNNCERLAEIYPNVYQALRYWQNNGIELVIYSNKGVSAIHSLLVKYNIASFFSLVVGGAGQFKQKPSTEVFYQVIQPHLRRRSPHQMMMIGDTVADIQFANNVGISSTWICHGYGRHKECLTVHPTYVAEGFSNKGLSLMVQVKC